VPVIEQWTNPDVLRWARERLNLTQRQVTEQSKKLARGHFAVVSQEELENWEAGRAEPELAQLETLAEIYACPVGYFFLHERPAEHLPKSAKPSKNCRQAWMPRNKTG
jgi:transcriptional regulator with XRE-family HTH domain